MQSSQSQNTGGQQENSVSPWLQSASQEAVTNAQAIANRPWSAFSGEAIAPENANQVQASQQAQSNAAAYQKSGMQTQATQAFTPENVQPYINPNTGAVVAQQAQRINQQFDPAQTSLTQGLASSGNLGSNRAALAQDQLDTQKNNALNDMGNAEYGNAVNAGTSAFFNARGNAAQEGANVEGALNSTGAEDRQTAQQNLNYNYQQFLAQRDWSTNNLAPLLAAVSGAKTDSSQSSQGMEAQTQNNLGSMVGSIAAIAGALGKTSFAQNLPDYFAGNTDLSGNLNEVPVTAQYMGGGSNGSGGLAGTGPDGGAGFDTMGANDIESGGWGGDSGGFDSGGDGLAALGGGGDD